MARIIPRILWVVLSVVAIVLLLAMGLGLYEAGAPRRRFLQANMGELRRAAAICVSHRHEYARSYPTNVWVGEYGTESEVVIRGITYRADIPQVLRDIRPFCILIRQDSVAMKVRTLPVGWAIVCTNQVKRISGKKVSNGIWLVDGLLQ